MVREKRKIRPPLLRIVRNLMRSIAPLLIWLVALLMLFLFHQAQFGQVDAVGILEMRSADVSTVIAGKIEQIGVAEFDTVQADQVVAVLDDSAIAAEQAVAKAQIEQLQAELAAAIKDLATDRLNDLRRFEVDEESARLDVLDRVVDLESDKAELARASLLINSQSKLIDKGIVARQVYEDLRITEDGLKAKVNENEKALEFARVKLKEATDRKTAYVKESKDVTSDTSINLDPLKKGISAQEQEVQRLTALAQQHILRAPISGVVMAANQFVGKNLAPSLPVVPKAGEVLMAGVPLIKIVDPRSSLVHAWVEEGNLSGNIQPGDNVQVVSRRIPTRTALGKILNIGQTLEQFPQRADPMAMPPKWGVRVVIGQVAVEGFMPGEMLDIKFSPTQSLSEKLKGVTADLFSEPGQP